MYEDTSPLPHRIGARGLVGRLVSTSAQAGSRATSHITMIIDRSINR